MGVDLSFANILAGSAANFLENADAFELHPAYQKSGARREALVQGSSAWVSGIVNLDGSLREPHPDEHLDCG